MRLLLKGLILEEKANDMKPTKNKIYCPSIRRAKMLFKEERKALNFIKFNRDTILEETGYAPSRAYYCPFCLGWHVTSNEDTALGKSLDAKDERIVGQAARHGAERLESGVTKGVTETSFQPGTAVNRAQLVAFLYRYQQI